MIINKLRPVSLTCSAGVSVEDVAGRGGVEGGCLGAQTVVAESDGDDAGPQHALNLGGREVAFGADEDEGVAARRVGAGEVAALDGIVAVAHVALRVGH